MVPPKYNLVLSLILFASVAISEAKPEALVLEDLVANTENFLKSYGVKENTLTKAKIFFEENVGSTEEISQTAKTVKKSIEKYHTLIIRINSAIILTLFHVKNVNIIIRTGPSFRPADSEAAGAMTPCCI